MNKNKRKKAITNSRTDFNDPNLLEVVSGTDYARAFYVFIVFSRLGLSSLYFFPNEAVHEFAQKT